MPKSSPLPRFLRFRHMVSIVSVILALVTIALTIIGFVDLSLIGFPDGHVTEYEKVSRRLRTALLWMNHAFGLYFFRLALLGLTMRAKVTRLLITLAVLMLLLAFTKIAIPWYFVNYLGLDNGHGG